MPCTHFFHTDCIKEWFKLNYSCPICKSIVDEDVINSQNDNWENNIYIL